MTPLKNARECPKNYALFFRIVAKATGRSEYRNGNPRLKVEEAGLWGSKERSPHAQPQEGPPDKSRSACKNDLHGASVDLFVCPLIPRLKQRQTFFFHKARLDPHGAFTVALHLPTGDVELVKAPDRNIFKRRPEDDLPKTSPMDRRKTHRTRLRRRIDHTIGEIVTFELARREANRIDLGMAGSITLFQDRIMPHRD